MKEDNTCNDCWGSGWETQFITPCRSCNGTGDKRHKRPPSTQEEPTTQKLMKHKVKHIASGETWLSLHMDDTHAYIAGWPPTVADIEHLEIIEACGEPDEKEVEHLLNAFGVDLRPKVISSEPTQEELTAKNDDLWYQFLYDVGSNMHLLRGETGPDHPEEMRKLIESKYEITIKRKI